MTAETTSSGRLFHIRGTSTEKATLPTADSLTGANCHYTVCGNNRRQNVIYNISYKTLAILVKFGR